MANLLTDSENAFADVLVFSSVTFATPDTVFNSDTTAVANSLISLLKRLVNVANSLDIPRTEFSVLPAVSINVSTAALNLRTCLSIDDSARRTWPPTTFAVLDNEFICAVSCFFDCLLNASILFRCESNNLSLSDINVS